MLGVPCPEFENTKEVIRIRISKNSRHYNDQKHIRTNKDLQNYIHIKLNELRCSGKVNNSCSNNGTRRVNLVTNPVISRERGNDREVFTTPPYTPRN